MVTTSPIAVIKHMVSNWKHWLTWLEAATVNAAKRNACERIKLLIRFVIRLASMEYFFSTKLDSLINRSSSFNRCVWMRSSFSSCCRWWLASSMSLTQNVDGCILVVSVALYFFIVDNELKDKSHEITTHYHGGLVWVRKGLLNVKLQFRPTKAHVIHRMVTASHKRFASLWHSGTYCIDWDLSWCLR